MDNDQRPKTIAEGVFLRLREDILRCSLLPGQRLRLDRLCESYGVGMSPLREALSRLSSIGLATADGQRGFSVTRISADDLLSLTKTRAWIETLALRFAIATGDRNWEAEILAASHRLSGTDAYDRDSGGFNEAWNVSHRAFHRALVAAGPSSYLHRYREHLFDLSDRYRRLSGRISVGGRDVAEEHRALSAATLERDVERASELMINHLVEAARLILKDDPDSGDRAAELIATLRNDIRAGFAGLPNFALS